jgi:mRNA-degrading endonuclease toxin of MazEF toxin-antitoxin module
VDPGDIYVAVDGSGGRRPFVVVSRADLNRGEYFLAVPFTSARLEVRRTLPNCVYFPAGAFVGLPRDCVAQAEALTQLRKTDLVPPGEPLGTVGAPAMARLIAAIGHVLDSDCHPRPPVATPATPVQNVPPG